MAKRRMKHSRVNKRKRKQRGGKFNATLSRIRKLSPTQRRQAMTIANDKFIRQFLSNVKKLRKAKLHPSMTKKLKRHSRALRKLVSKKTSLKAKRKVLSQQGGFLPLLLAALPAVGSIVGGIISRT